MYSFQNSPQYWQAADEFRPERFLPNGSSSTASTNPAFAPFGDVRRPCGQAAALNPLPKVARSCSGWLSTCMLS